MCGSIFHQLIIIYGNNLLKHPAAPGGKQLIIYPQVMPNPNTPNDVWVFCFPSNPILFPLGKIHIVCVTMQPTPLSRVIIVYWLLLLQNSVWIDGCALF